MIKYLLSLSTNSNYLLITRIIFLFIIIQKSKKQVLQKQKIGSTESVHTKWIQGIDLHLSLTLFLLIFINKQLKLLNII